ncbi:hypothetical protein [Nocardia lijiangensis]|uniref:hypothetical protein n=1 Tax=Nocardia lijiangensis TaxID=299618 RepID=UPI00082DA634|nr:hypothetical protein [Nocardia lijiangensis]
MTARNEGHQVSQRACWLGVLTAVVASGIAAPSALAEAPEPPSVHYRVEVVGDTVMTTVDNAHFAVAESRHQVELRDPAGRVLESLPMAYSFDGAVHPLAESISDDGRTLTLRPDVSQVELAPRTVASPLEEQRALTELSNSLTRGPLLGTVVGTVVGAVVGAAIGAASCLVVGPACIATIPAAAMAFAAGGGVAGTLVGGGVALADGLWKYLSTIQSPPGQSPYADRDGVDTPNGVIPDANLRLPSGSASGMRSGSSSGSAR